MILYHKWAAFFPKGKEISPASKTSRFAPGKQLLNEKYRTILLGMKLAGFFMLVACLQAGAKGFSQSITLTGKDLPLRQVFDRIEDQTGYGIFIDKATLAESKPVTINFKDATIELVMKACLKEQPFPLTFTITGHTINVIKVGEVDSHRPNTDATPAGPPTIIPEVKGRVTNEAGEPLQGASVEVKNMKTGTITDVRGVFTLKKIPSDAIFEVSFTGYQKTTVKLTGGASLEIVLKVATNSLDQVQVIAYGTTTQRLNTGDVSTLTAKEIEEQPVVSPLEALEGRIPGLFIAQGTGMPGSSFTVQVRGQNSITNGNDPLYIIDGVPYSSELLTGLNPSLGNPLNFINTADIESINVLKDADATAIYGSRGANGVILITTKKGQAGRTKVDLNVYTGYGSITRKVDYLNTAQYLEMRHEAFANDGMMPGPGDVDIDGTWDTTRYTDWQKMLIEGTAKYTDAQGSISGGNANTQYLIGAGYHRQTTVEPGNLYEQKGSVHFNIHSSSSDHRFNIQLTGNYVADGNNLLTGDIISELASLPPDAPTPLNPNGSLNWANSTWPQGNPLATLKASYSGRTSNLVANSVLSYRLFTGLDLLTSLGYTSTLIKETVVYPTTIHDPAYGITSGSSNFSNNDINSWIVEPQLKYQAAWGKGKLDALLGTTFEEMNSDGLVLSATGFTSDDLLRDIQAASSITVAFQTNAQYKYNAVFGRLNYAWDQRYIINATVRRDGSSRFGPVNQFSNFGAIGVAWLFGREPFVSRAMPLISSGKLRASYGVTGNDQIGDYKFLNLYSAAATPYEGVQTLYPVSLYNPNLAWERNRKAEGGLELGLAKDRILANVSYYVNRSSNQLVSTPVSSVTGFSSIEENLPALVQNSGTEVSVTIVNIKARTFRWTSTVTFTIPRNKLVAFPNLANSYYNTAYQVGKPINVVKLYHMAGVNDSTGVYQFSSAKGGVTYNPQYPTDLTSVVDLFPKYYGGLGNSFQYKEFSLEVFFQVVHQTGAQFPYGVLPGSEGNQQPDYVLSRWRKPGDHTNIQEFSQNYGGPAFSEWINARDYSDQFYGNASFVRLKNLSVSYTFSRKSLEKMHVENLRLYIQGQNLLTFTKYMGYDPENQSTSAIPPLRVLTAGIQITL